MFVYCTVKVYVSPFKALYSSSGTFLVMLSEPVLTLLMNFTFNLVNWSVPSGSLYERNTMEFSGFWVVAV